jgi:hypothetical protein
MNHPALTSAGLISLFGLRPNMAEVSQYANVGRLRLESDKLALQGPPGAQWSRGSSNNVTRAFRISTVRLVAKSK